MWKSLNRGLRETIDRGLSVFKNDTSRGTSLISSLTKDLDDISVKTNTNHECCIISDAEVVPTLQHESQPRKHVLDQSNSNAPKDFPLEHDCCAKSFAATPTTLLRSRHSSNVNEISQPNGEHDLSSGNFDSYSCKECAKNGRKASEWGIPSGQRSMWFSPTVLHRESSHMLLETSKFKQKSSLAANSTNIDPPEGKPAPFISATEFRKLKASVKFPSLENDFSLLPRNHNSSRKSCHSTSNKSRQLISNEKTTYCLLKLPFLCYDVGHSSRWNKFCAGWFVKSRGECEKGSDGRSGGSKYGEREETKDNAWKYYEMHQSFLEAIGWSSALLFGWFFGQCRMRRMIGDAQNEHDANHKRNCCIMASMTKLLRSWSTQHCAPLRVLPTESNEIHPGKDDGVHSSENGRTAKNESLVTVSDEVHSTNNSFSHETSEDSLYSSHDFFHKMTSVNAPTGNAIPMPWHADVAEKLVFGPITLEEAIKEAGKGLEEAQSEVLLALALHKLDEGNESSMDEPSASELLQSAASLGNAAAAFNLGICYEKGVGGVVENLIQAYHWYKLASDKGHAAATYNLAVFHANGLAGLNPNTRLANRLLVKASSLGLPEAVEALASLSSLDDFDSSYSIEDDAVDGDSGSTSNPNQRESVISPESSSSSASPQSWKVGSTEFTTSASHVPYHNSNSHGEDSSGSSVDHSLKVKSNSSDHGKELNRSQMKLDHFSKLFGLPAGGEEFLSDLLHDNMYNLKNSDLECNSVQVLSH